MTNTSVPAVYKAICAVTADLARDGIPKDRKNQQQGYNFRGIDDCYAAVSPLLAKHKLCILPRVVGVKVTERQSKGGGALFYTTLKVDFDFVSAEDGSKHTVTMIGEAMDSADKSSNKAMSAAYKYACLQTFSIPTEGDNDPDATTHEVAPAKKSAKTNGTPRQSAPKTNDKRPQADHKYPGEGHAIVFDGGKKVYEAGALPTDADRLHVAAQKFDAALDAKNRGECMGIMSYAASAKGLPKPSLRILQRHAVQSIVSRLGANPDAIEIASELHNLSLLSDDDWLDIKAAMDADLKPEVTR